MPFTAASFGRWPLPRTTLDPHYEAVLADMPFTGADDDLSTLFPLYKEPQPLPPLAPRTTMVLDAYRKHRERLNSAGVVVGHARLAVDTHACVRCGLCMTGCPYRLIYSASSTLERLTRTHRLRRRSGYLALRVENHAGGATVVAKELQTGRLQRFDADRVVLACGAVGSTRVIANSQPYLEQQFHLQESAQFLLPVVSRRPIPDPRDTTEFTLNQFNMVLGFDDDADDVSQVHFYPYNPAVASALPGPLKRSCLEPARKALLRRLSVGLGYLPSWASPEIDVRIQRSLREDELPDVTLDATRAHTMKNRMFRDVARRLLHAAPYLDLWPVLPMTSFAAPGKSYHFGSSLPHRNAPRRGEHATDLLGRVPGFDRVHVVDGAVFPSVPATTFTLTIMANAHRIASTMRTL
jgi:ferredoxin